MITITEQEFKEYTGVDLQIELKDLDDGVNKIPRTLKLWASRIYGEMTRPVKDDDKLTPFQIETIKNSIIEYGEYYFKNGDLYRSSGFDEDKGKLIDTTDIERIRMPKHITESLRKAGLIRTSIGRRYAPSQTHDDFY